MTDAEKRLKKLDDNRYLLEKSGAMRVDGIVYVDEELLGYLGTDESIKQVENVASLPGIVGASLAMPDIHWGYGFPIGGVAAFDAQEGIISPGGVGYDINCGVRLLRSALNTRDIKDVVPDIVDGLFRNIPSGVGSRRKDLKLSRAQLGRVLLKGANWALEEGFGNASDLEYIEDRGCVGDADPEAVSDRAYERGKDQLGTLGSGNHFVEVGYIAEVFDEDAARAFGLFKDQVTVMIHTGSRGLGYQICDESIREMLRAAEKYHIPLADRQLCCAPLASPEGRRYFSAMAAAANYAFANRQMITHWVRETLEKVFASSEAQLGLSLVYDVCHNIAKRERHKVHGKELELCVHRKGATRAFAPGSPLVPERYRSAGQPVLVPGDMGRASYVLAGTPKAMEETFGSTCHGAGRVMSRNQAVRMTRGRSIPKEMEERGVCVRAAGKATLGEEVPEAYKDVSKVVGVVHRAGISKLVAKIVPMGAIKG
ncbi:MAG TPA: RtcB family protein [Syntrophorhabdaceae bacterium]|nr:RtcB family protein [Syntrophorhabdaceae bacterium]